MCFVSACPHIYIYIMLSKYMQVFKKTENGNVCFNKRNTMFRIYQVHHRAPRQVTGVVIAPLNELDTKTNLHSSWNSCLSTQLNALEKSVFEAHNTRHATRNTRHDTQRTKRHKNTKQHNTIHHNTNITQHRTYTKPVQIEKRPTYKNIPRRRN